jgi:hypothetical protein
MAKLPVIDEKERHRIRLKLQAYQDRHGKIGAPDLCHRMQYMLDGRDRTYIDLRSLQRFLTGTHRTSDEKVIRYRRFLDLVAEPSVAEQVAAIFDQSIDIPPQAVKSLEDMVVQRDPEFRKDKTAAPPRLMNYVGRYELTISPRDELQKAGRAFKRDMHECELRPTTNPKFLEFIQFGTTSTGGADNGLKQLDGDGMMMWFGPGTYLLLRNSVAGGIVGLVRQLSDEPITFEGALLVSSARDIDPMNARTITLRKIGDMEPDPVPE